MNVTVAHSQLEIHCDLIVDNPESYFIEILLKHLPSILKTTNTFKK